MKNIALIALATLLCAAVPIRAEDLADPEWEAASEAAPPPEAFMAPPAPGEPLPPEPPPGFGAGPAEGLPITGCRPGEPPHHVERWLERLRARNPEEFERLQALRREDPEAFRRTLAQRLWRARMKGGGRPGGFQPIVTPEIEKLERETRDMGRAYRAAATDEERNAVRAELRAKLQTLFDLRERERAQRIGEIEKDLSELKAALERRAARRDQIIEQRLLQLTEGDTLAW